MPLFRPNLLAPKLIALTLCSAAPIYADTTPQEVWDLVKREAGPALTATPSRRGEALILTRGRVQFPDGFALLLPDVTLRQQQDGSVTVELPPRFPLVLDLPDAPGTPDKLTLNVAISGFSAIMRDIGPEDVDFSLSASTISALMDPIGPIDGQVQDADISAVLAGADLRLNWQSSFGSSGEASALADFNLATLNFDLRVDLPGEVTKLNAVADLSGLSGDLDLRVPAKVIAAMKRDVGAPEPTLPEMLDLLQAGLKLKAHSKSGPLTLSVEGHDPQNGPFTLSLKAAGLGAEVGLDREAVLYDVGLGSTQLDFKGQVPDLQTDSFSLGITELREILSLDLPSDANPSPDWRMLYKFDGITLSDSLWDEADPQKLVPRGPISLVLDSSGTWTLDPRLMRGMILRPDENPLAALTFNLTEARIEGAGVKMTGSGGLDFDFADRSRYIEEVPVPEGKLSFLTIGANGLLDKLVSAGALTSEELSGFRMGMMFLGKAVTGQTDHLATELEFRSGSFFLNGQKIR